MKNSFLFFASLTIACIAAEILCRVSGTYSSYRERTSDSKYVSPFETRCKWGYGWEETPPPFTEVNPGKTEYDYKWTANNEGLRGSNFVLEKKGKRIAVFGDSFTESMGVANDSTYPQLLQNLIKSLGDSTTEVMNCGAGGADVFTEYKLLTGKILKYKPDLLILTFNSTDIYEYTIRLGFERFKPNNQVQYRTPPWFEPYYAKSYFIRLLVHDILNYDYRFLRPAEATDMDTLSVNNVIAAIDSFRATCTVNNIQFFMVFHPLQHEYNQSSPYGNIPIIEYCRHNRILFADNFEYMKKAGVNNSNLQEYYYPLDGHYKTKGYEILAQCAFDLLVKCRWLSGSNEENNKPN